MRTITSTKNFNKVLQAFNLTENEGKVNQNFFDDTIIDLDYGIYEDGRFYWNDETNVYTKMTCSFDESETKVIHTLDMTFVERDDIILLVDDEDNTEKLDKIFLIASMYDHYTDAIDNGGQRRDALDSNKRYLKELRYLGCYQVTWKDMTLMYQPTKDLTFNLGA